uniref:Uncharacterized protein n=1 Tax=Tetradesmus obliquus TaxID=3088 RepID=A0A383WMB1_TETOB|eukprot:jgi/Sobl393_1/1647/SZX78607.1
MPSNSRWLLCLLALAALHLDAASRLLQQEQAATRNSSADHLSEMYGATPTVNQDDQRTLWIAVVPELPTDADVDVDVPAGWQSHITTKDGHGETWTWNVSHSSVPADKASATVDTWCNTVRPLRTGAMHVYDTNFDLLALIAPSIRSSNYSLKAFEDITLPVPYTPTVPRLTLTAKLYLYSNGLYGDWRSLPAIDCSTMDHQLIRTENVTMLSQLALKFLVEFTYLSESSQSVDAFSVSLAKGGDSNTIILDDSGYKLTFEGLGFGSWTDDITVQWPLGGKVPLSVIGVPLLNGRMIWDTKPIAVVGCVSKV